MSERTHRTGPFKPGDRVQLTDPKKRQHTITLATGGQFHTHRGILSHDDLIGEPEGIVVKSTAGTPYLALRPLLSDYTLSMPRGAQVIYPKDAALIVGFTDVFPGAHVVEAGAGSGSLSCSLLRAVGDSGSVHSYELRPEFADVARGNVLRFFGEQHPSWTLTVGDVTDADDTDVDRVVLDMLNPWDVLDTVSRMLVPGGVVCCYVATTTQLSRTVEALRSHGTFTEPWSMESLVRPWHVEGLAVRPDHRMVAHTAFLAFSRKLADGVEPPPVRRRPSKGMEN